MYSHKHKSRDINSALTRQHTLDGERDTSKEEGTRTDQTRTHAYAPTRTHPLLPFLICILRDVFELLLIFFCSPFHRQLPLFPNHPPLSIYRLPLAFASLLISLFVYSSPTFSSHFPSPHSHCPAVSTTWSRSGK